MSRPSRAEGAPAAVDHSADARVHGSRAVRAFFLVLGTLFVGLGIAGVVLPVLPTTPFLLVAAACYARGSARFYSWLLNHRVFGPTIVEWRRHRSIPWRTKLVAIAMMATTLGISVAFFVPGAWLKVALAALGVLLAAWMYRIPSRDRPKHQG